MAPGLWPFFLFVSAVFFSNYLDTRFVNKLGDGI